MITTIILCRVCLYTVTIAVGNISSMCMMYHSSYHLQYDIPHLSTFIWNCRFMSTFKEDYDGALNERLKQGTCTKPCHINSHNSSSIYRHHHHHHHLYHINSTCIYDIGTVEYR